MILSKSFERLRNNQNHVLEVCCSVNSKDDIGDLSYQDYIVKLYVNGKYVAEISDVLDNAGLFTDLVDSIEWEELYADKMAEKEEAA